MSSFSARRHWSFSGRCSGFSLLSRAGAAIARRTLSSPGPCWRRAPLRSQALTKHKAHVLRWIAKSRKLLQRFASVARQQIGPTGTDPRS